MTDKRRSPYLVLGLAFGASKGDAAKAFARATRRLRRTPDAPYDIEDLNWALHAVEQRIDDPGTSIDDYRMPADPSVYDVPTGTGLLNPGVAPLERRTAASSAGDLEAVKANVIREVASAIAEEIKGAPLPVLHRYTEEGS
jgi:hypothetical protein